MGGSSSGAFSAIKSDASPSSPFSSEKTSSLLGPGIQGSRSPFIRMKAVSVARAVILALVLFRTMRRRYAVDFSANVVVTDTVTGTEYLVLWISPDKSYGYWHNLSGKSRTPAKFVTAAIADDGHETNVFEIQPPADCSCFEKLQALKTRQSAIYTNCWIATGAPARIRMVYFLCIQIAALSLILKRRFLAKQRIQLCTKRCLEIYII
jgi:hypothetical protein